MSKLSEGNRLMREKRYEAAIALYTEALDTVPMPGLRLIIHANLALARQKSAVDRRPSQAAGDPCLSLPQQTTAINGTPGSAPEKLAFVQADYAGYPAAIAQIKSRYLDYPRSVSIETLVKCNSQCNFCPYPTSPRQGQELPDELFYKILDDLTHIPRSHPFTITLARINEPLLDRRLPAFCSAIAEKLPAATQQFWTNGTMLKKGAFEWMTRYPRSTLTVSLNSVDDSEHTRMMGFGVKGVFQGLDYLHGLVASGQFQLPITLCAPFHHNQQALHYQTVCRERWPLFKPAIRPFFQWMGESRQGATHRAASGLPTPDLRQVARFPCGQWFDLHILANGYVTKCCIDETGYSEEEFSIRNRSVLEIYQSGRTLREQLSPRSEVNGCEGCLHLG